MYPAEIVIPMKEEMTENGFQELLTPSDVEEVLSKLNAPVLNTIVETPAPNPDDQLGYIAHVMDSFNNVVTTEDEIELEPDTRRDDDIKSDKPPHHND